MADSSKTSGESARSAADQNSELGAHAVGLAHDIENPLSTIRLNMQLLAEDLLRSDRPSDRRALGNVQLVLNQCTRLELLLKRFFALCPARTPN